MIFKKEVIEKISRELSLPYTGVEQDWDIEMANSERICDFIKFYRNGNLSKADKVATMALLLASYDDFLTRNDGQANEDWDEIRTILLLDKKILADVIEYWALISNPDEHDIFSITPFIQEVVSATR